MAEKRKKPRAEGESKGKRRSSISRRLTMFMACLMLVMTVVVLFISYNALRSTYLKLYNEKAQDVVRTLAGRIDGDRLEQYFLSGETDEYYDWLQVEFNTVKTGFTGINYLYLFYPQSDRFTYLVEGHKPDDDPDLFSYLGDEFEYGETEYAHLVPDIQAKRASQDLIQGADAGYGQTISAWAPVLDSMGKVTGMVEADCVLSDLNAVVRGHAGRIVAALLVCILLVLFLALRIIDAGVSVPLGRLTKMVDSYEHGRLTETRFKHDDEIQWLATSFTDMTHRIDAYTEEVARATAEHERMGVEFQVAKQIQADMLPSEFPPFPDHGEFDLAASLLSSTEICGDYFDYFLIDEDHLGLVVGDVSDKGVPAALYMVIVKTLMKNLAVQGFGPGDVLQKVNEQLLEGHQSGLYAAVWFAVLELSTGKGIAVNAGYQHPALRRAGQRFELQKYHHLPPVGAIDGVRYRDHGFQLKPGDTLFIFSDGIQETKNPDGESFGTDRVLEALNREPDASPNILQQTMRSAVDRFMAGNPQTDDLTLLCLKYYGPKGNQD